MGSKQMKRRIFYGTHCDQQVYTVPDGVRLIEQYDLEKQKKNRFENEEAYKKFKLGIARRNHNRKFHANFPQVLYTAHLPLMMKMKYMILRMRRKSERTMWVH